MELSTLWSATSQLNRDCETQLLTSHAYVIIALGMMLGTLCLVARTKIFNNWN